MLYTASPAIACHSRGRFYYTGSHHHAHSSSLASPAQETSWNNNKERGDGRTIVVPTVTLAAMIAIVPNTTKISIVKTDMQGYYFAAVKQAASILRERVPYLYSEVWLDDVYSYDARNDFCRDWWPFMDDLGYDLIRLGDETDRNKIKKQCQEQLALRPIRPSVDASAGYKESDAFWVRNNSKHEPLPDPEGTLEKRGHIWGKEDYEKCL